MMSESKEKKGTLSFGLWSLPDDLALNCIARVSISDYRALSLVSKKYKSLVVSPDIYKMRSLMGRTEKRLYICLSTFGLTNLYKSILYREKRLSPVSWLPFELPNGCSLVVLDWSIYIIGGWTYTYWDALSGVRLLDCRTHTWRPVPSMSVARVSPAAGVIDGKIYVIGGCKSDENSLCWGEVFDPNTQTWDNLVPLTDRNPSDHLMGSLVADDKFYTMSNRGVVYYSPRESRWVRMTEKEDFSKLGMHSYCCGIDNLLYGCNREGNVFWSESNSETLDWKQVKGLEPLSINQLGCPTRCSNKLINIGMNIMLIWYHHSLGIQSCEISFRRTKDKREVWGKVEWSQTVPSKLIYGDYVELECCASVNI